MFYILSKLLDTGLSPLCWAMALVAMGLLAPQVAHPILARWMHRAPVAGLLLLYFSSIEVVSNALWRWVEAPPLTTIREEEVYDVVVILGGMLEDRTMRTYGKAYYNDNIDRLIAARELLATGKARRALLSGGDEDPRPDSVDEALVLRDQLIAWGIEPERLFVETRSRNTRENAVESAAILRREGWKKILLVTSAFHMPRALGCFRAVGIEPDTLAVDLRSDRSTKGFSDLLPRSHSLHMTASALRELAGRFIYRLRGYSR
ncbi:MAG: YdcF family protein [Myxococcales bacterium]|nr:YdcF family protein [Polyangiaceae bacterium]MDW8249027.1 YdcF family protein [Myxococcales bacterium]